MCKRPFSDQPHSQNLSELVCMLLAVVASPKPECANAPRAYPGRLQYTLSLRYPMYPIHPTLPQVAVDRRGSHRLAGEMRCVRTGSTAGSSLFLLLP